MIDAAGLSRLPSREPSSALDFYYVAEDHAVQHALIFVLAELRQGKLGQLCQTEADDVITALERRIEGLSAEMRELR